MDYDVTVYAVVRVKVPRVTGAASQQEACRQVLQSLNLDALFPPSEHRLPVMGKVATSEYAEEIVRYLVDEVGDEEFERSQHYTPEQIGEGDFYRQEGRINVPKGAGICPRCKETIPEADWTQHIIAAVTTGDCPLVD